jgi:hypothetical protein
MAPRPLATWLLALVGAGLLAFGARWAALGGVPAITSGRFILRIKSEDDGGRKWETVHTFTGVRARMIGAGLVATALFAGLWILPTLWPGWWRSPLRKRRFLLLSLAVYAPALLLIWPPVPLSGIAAATYFYLIEFAVWRRVTRGMQGLEREKMRGLALMGSLMMVNAVGLALFGPEALWAAWIGAALSGIAILHFSLLRAT